jgi:glycosyltransferase involved in cell wall biosynthesis
MKTSASRPPRKIAVVGQFPPPYGGYPHQPATFVKLPFDKDTELVQFKTNHHFNTHLTGIGVSEIKNVVRQVASMPGFLQQEQPTCALVFLVVTRSMWRDLYLINTIRKKGVPVIVKLIAGDGPKVIAAFPPAVRRMILSVLGKTQGILVETCEQIEQFAKLLPGLPVYWYPNHIHAGDFPPPITREVLNGPPGIAYMGNLTHLKGVETILQTVDIVCEQFPAHYHFIGGEKDPGYLEDFRTRASQLKHGHRVTVHGRIERAEAFPTMQKCQIYAFPSYWPGEGQPASLLEAMMLGLVPIASPWRGIPEIVKDGKNGLLVEVKNPQALAEAICKVLGNAELRATLSAEAYKTVKNEFAAEAALRRFNEATDKILR